MKTRRTKAQWLSLINEFEQSGLTQTEFCNQRGINPKYFSLRRMKLTAQPESSGFIQAVAGDPRAGVSVHSTAFYPARISRDSIASHSLRRLNHDQNLHPASQR